MKNGKEKRKAPYLGLERRKQWPEMVLGLWAQNMGCDNCLTNTKESPN